MPGVLVERETLQWLIALGRKIEAAQVLNPGFIGREALRVMPRLAGGGSSLRMFKTPSGGIAAASGTTPGSATCTEYPSGMAGSPGATKTVKNHRTSIIPGEVFILVQAFGADLYCVEGNCPTAGGISEVP